ncbi:MAG: NifU family protein [Fimbriimonadales bacterium]
MKLISRLFKRTPAGNGPLFEPVRQALQDVQAYANSHGGQIRLLGVSEAGEVVVRLSGTCSGCPLSDVTLKVGVEARLMKLVPGVTKVVVK